LKITTISKNDRKLGYYYNISAKPYFLLEYDHKIENYVRFRKTLIVDDKKGRFRFPIIFNGVIVTANNEARAHFFLRIAMIMFLNDIPIPDDILYYGYDNYDSN